MTFQETKEIVTFGLTLWGLIIASKGLSTWKKQIRGNKEFEAGYNLNLAVLKLRQAVKRVRHPAIWPSESQMALRYTLEKYPDTPKEKIQANLNPYVYEMRWEKITEASIEIESHLLAAETLWGPTILGLMKPVYKKVTELHIALEQHFQPEFKTKNTTEIFDVMYGPLGETGDDVFSKELNEAISSITKYIQDKIY